MEFKKGDKVFVTTGANGDHECLADVVGMPFAKIPGQRGAYIDNNDNGTVIQIKWVERGDKEVVSCSRCKKFDVSERRSLRNRIKRESDVTTQKRKKDNIIDLTTTPCSAADRRSSGESYYHEQESIDKNDVSTVDYYPCSFSSSDTSEPGNAYLPQCATLESPTAPFSTFLKGNYNPLEIQTQELMEDKRQTVFLKEEVRRLQNVEEKLSIDNRRQGEEIRILRAENAKQKQELMMCKTTIQKNEVNDQKLIEYKRKISKLEEEVRMLENCKNYNNTDSNHTTSGTQRAASANQTSKFGHESALADSTSGAFRGHNLLSRNSVRYTSEANKQKENIPQNRESHLGSMHIKKTVGNSMAQKKSGVLIQKRRATMSKNMGLVKLQQYKPPMQQAPPLKKRKNIATN